MLTVWLRLSKDDCEIVSIGLLVACGLDEICGVKETVSIAVYDVTADRLDITETDWIADSVCFSDTDAVKVVVELGDGSLLADADRTETGEGVFVWQGELEDNTDSELVIDAKGEWDITPV